MMTMHIIMTSTHLSGISGCCLGFKISAFIEYGTERCELYEVPLHMNIYAKVHTPHKLT